MLSRLLLPVLLLLCATTTATASTTSRTLTFFSRALDRETTYIAVLPSPLDEGRRYPVLYLLHGAYGSYLDWTSNTSLTVQLQHPMIIVTPDGGEFGWYVDSLLTPHSNYETLIARDLIEHVDATLPTSATRTARGIAGLSMGGHGALSLAAKHPELFGSASSLSGILHLQAHPISWELPKRLGELPAAAAEWEKHSVLNLVPRFQNADVALLFDTGTSDSAKALPDNRAVHQRLEELGVPHVYNEYPGNHNWAYWSGHLQEHLDFHAVRFGIKTR